jgi:molybdopterin-guanine dinucleotide biosynthesis protein A
MPEPLIGIWEPKGLALAEKFIQETGKSCPRKFLINEDICQIYPENDQELFNANFPEDYEEAKSKIEQLYNASRA